MTDLFWWPDIKSLEDLEVTDTEEGFLLTAPDQTLCSEWLAYWAETPERQTVFSREFLKTLLEHANKILEQQGESTLLEQQNDSSDPQKVGAGSKQAD